MRRDERRGEEKRRGEGGEGGQRRGEEKGMKGVEREAKMREACEDASLGFRFWFHTQSHQGKAKTTRHIQL